MGPDEKESDVVKGSSFVRHENRYVQTKNGHFHDSNDDRVQGVLDGGKLPRRWNTQHEAKQGSFAMENQDDLRK